MDKITLIATLSFGLEAVVKRELMALGFANIKASNGKVEFEATPDDIPTANLWLRSADRVLLKMAAFPAATFDDLFEQTRALLQAVSSIAARSTCSHVGCIPSTSVHRAGASIHSGGS